MPFRPPLPAPLCGAPPAAEAPPFEQPYRKASDSPTSHRFHSHLRFLLYASQSPAACMDINRSYIPKGVQTDGNVTALGRNGPNGPEILELFEISEFGLGRRQLARRDRVGKAHAVMAAVAERLV